MPIKAGAVIVAGGRGMRFGGSVRKQYSELNGHPLVWWSLKAFDAAPSVRSIVLVVPPEDTSLLKDNIKKWKISKPVQIVAGGKERSDSVQNGLRAVPSDAPWVAVHDAARPLVTVDLIEKTLAEAQHTGAALAAFPSKDTVKLTENGQWVQSTQKRENVWLAQTPQCFDKSLLERAHRENKHNGPATDDAQMVEWLGTKVRLVEGSADNIKVTVPTDLQIAETLLQKRGEKKSSTRVGFGYDIHKLKKGRPLWLGGVRIPFAKGLDGHSDADALLHAITDALLGAAALPDIGHYFPPSNPKIKGISSTAMLTKALDEVHHAGFRVVNVDSVIIAEEPKVGPFREAMRKAIASTLQIPISNVQIKGKTNEGLGDIGKGFAIAAHAVVLLES